MIAEFDPVGRFRKERSQAALSLAERKVPSDFAFDLEEVEGEIGLTGAPALGGLLHMSSNDVTPSGRTSQSSPSR